MGDNTCALYSVQLESELTFIPKRNSKGHCGKPIITRLSVSVHMHYVGHTFIFAFLFKIKGEEKKYILVDVSQTRNVAPARKG